MTVASAKSARSRAAGRLRTAACLGAVGLSAWWALAPLTTPDLSTPQLNELEASPDGPRLAALDVDAFRVPIWVAPPAPPEPEAVPSPPPPLRLQLVAVIGGEESYSAVLYDPDADRLVVVAPGETLAQGRVVEGVTARGVRIRDGETVRMLAVRDDGAGTP